MIEFNVLIGKTTERDKDLFFGPLTKEDKFIVEEENIRFPQLLKKLGVFPSTSEAWRCGWKEIPEGFTDVKIGKFKKRLTILKITHAYN